MAVLHLLAVLQLDTKLCGNDDAVTIGLQCFAHQFFVGKRSVHFGRIKKGNATVDSGFEKGNAFFFIDGIAVGVVQSHATESQSRNFKATLSKFAFFHFISFRAMSLIVPSGPYGSSSVSIARRSRKWPMFNCQLSFTNGGSGIRCASSC